MHNNTKRKIMRIFILGNVISTAISERGNGMFSIPFIPMCSFQKSNLPQELGRKPIFPCNFLKIKGGGGIFKTK